MARLLTALRALFGRERTNADVADELAHHVALEIEYRVSSGMAPEEARRTALRDIGAHDRWVEETRAARGWAPIDELRQDVRYALRQVARNPGFHLVVVGVLAIGIGANTAVLTVTNALRSRPAPGVAANDNLMRVLPRLQYERGVRDGAITYPAFLALQELDDFSAVAAWTDTWVAVGESGDAPERIQAQLVSTAFFAVLGVRMRHGSGLALLDDAVTSSFAPNAVVSYRYWQTRLGARPDVVGTRITVNGTPFFIAGVAPRKFNGAIASEDWHDLWIPIAAASAVLPASADDLLRERQTFQLVARVGSGASAAQASGAAATALRLAMPSTAESRAVVVGVDVLPLRAVARGDGLFTAAASGGVLSAIILLIAIANASNLLLARALSRRREIGVRMSMGGGRARVLRQLLTESLIIALLAALGGALLVLWAARAFDQLMPIALDTSPHWRTFALTGGVAALTGVLFGVLPALHAVRVPVFDVLKAGASGIGASRSRLQGTFVAAQVALSLPLLTGLALFLAEARALENSDLGVDAERIAAAPLLLQYARLNAGQANTLFADLQERIAALPGVSAVSLANGAPLFDTAVRTRQFGRADRPDDDGVRAHYIAADAAYFEVMGIDILAGRAINHADVHGGQRVAVVSEDFARQMWPREDPIGRQLLHFIARPEVLPNGETEYVRDRVVSTVVGIAGQVRLGLFGDTHRPLRPGERRSFEATPLVYLPRLQETDTQSAVILVRSATSSAAVLPGLRTALRSIDKRIAVESVRTFEARRHEMLWVVRRIVGLLLFVGMLAALLACIGIYSVISYAVKQRTRDIAVRMAVGARPWQVATLFFRRGIILAAAGIIVAAPLVALTRYIVISTGGGAAGSVVAPIAIGAVAVLVLGVAALASWLPARRVANVDPLVALRAE